MTNETQLLHLLKTRNDTAVRPEANETRDPKNEHDAHRNALLETGCTDPKTPAHTGIYRPPCHGKTMLTDAPPIPTPHKDNGHAQNRDPQHQWLVVPYTGRHARGVHQTT